MKNKLNTLIGQRSWAFVSGDFQLAMWCSMEIERIRKLIKEKENGS